MFAERRKRLLEAIGPDAIAVFLGAKLAPRSNDTDYRFRQDSDFWYLTGFSHPNAVAVLRTDGGPEFTLFVEPRDPEVERWTGCRRSNRRATTTRPPFATGASAPRTAAT